MQLFSLKLSLSPSGDFAEKDDFALFFLKN